MSIALVIIVYLVAAAGLAVLVARWSRSQPEMLDRMMEHFEQFD